MTNLPSPKHNNPPDPIKDFLAKHADELGEMDSWLDGKLVETEGQMKAVDGLIKSIKAIEKEAKDEKDREYRPHKAMCDAIVARWKVPLGDFSDTKTGLIKINEPFKKRLAERKAAAQRKAYNEAEAARIAAQVAAETADPTNIADVRAASALADEASDAVAVLQAARNDKVKGLRRFVEGSVDDYVACMAWIQQNHWMDMTDFVDVFIDGKVREGLRDIPGVTIVRGKRAF